MSATIGGRLAVTLGAAAVVLMTVGVPTATAENGQSAVTDPKAVPSPGSLTTRVSTDACDDTTTPGWISTTEPTLTARTTAPGARFKVWDETGAKIFDQSARTAADGTVQVRPAGLAEGAGYSWQVWPDYGPGGGKPTAACHFGVDATAPQFTVESTDFPASGSGATPLKYAGQNGTFTVKGTDQGSGVACYQYVLNGTPSVGTPCQGAGTVAAGADGTATFRLKPAQWGTNVLTVQAVDNAGNTTPPVTYTFYAPSNPNPPVAPGDVNGDGVPDILLPDTAGNLQIISADATTTAPTSTVAAVRAPGGAGWNGVQLLHRGWDRSHAPVDDLMAHRPGDASISLYRNFDMGAFARGVISVGRDVNPFDPPAVPEGFTPGWSKATQLVPLGALGTDQRTSILTVEDGDLWLSTDPGFLYGYQTFVKISTTGAWAGYDLIAPGKAADGTLALWSRDRATGELRTHPIAKGADGRYDVTALADPTTGTVIGSFPVAAYPTLGSSGDGDGDGQPDLYAVTADRHLLTFSGTTAPKDLGTLH
ncbi:hypothetical protein ACIRD3_12395 [Kitasatospora sp. NPDC093550]|uniref:hypothetical protein n=1 Tax=Kitasatospora sp. NPDC093550 TaxID=3364089 RepID=UPI0037F784A4